jgi:2-desacetyl-2-hydroxyethyl bacteriochlorophyllide A dehydrogenase
MLKETMRALVYEGPRQMRIREQEIPSPGKDEVLIQIAFSGICGSELSGYLGQNSLRVPPLVMGHEFSGTIAAVGPDVFGLSIGDKVTANPLASCGACEICLDGSPQLCSARSLLGAHVAGSYAEYVLAQAKNVYLLPEKLSMEEAALTEPFACAVHICRLLQLDPSERLLIVGAGPIGLFALQAAQQFGLSDIVVMDLNEDRLAIAQEIGAITAASPEQLSRFRPASGFDAAVDAVGRSATRQTAINQLRPGGKVALSGLHEADSVLPINQIIRSEHRLYGAFAYAPKDFVTALEWLADKKVRMLPWTEFHPLEEGGDCFEKLLSSPGKVAKILLHP